MFQSTNYLTAQYYDASENSGNSAGEYSDVNDFLEVVREIFVSLEIYPANYEGLFGVTWDKLTEAKKGLNDIASKYAKNYSKSTLEPIKKVWIGCLKPLKIMKVI